MRAVVAVWVVDVGGGSGGNSAEKEVGDVTQEG